MITVSTSKSTNRAYHHGDLRAALVEAGLRHLESDGEAEISLRQLAREAGVSATAVYRHFPDKRALLAALASEGVRRLGAAQRQGSDAAGGGREGFAATGRAYVQFAIDNPALFRLAFTHAASDFDPRAADDEASNLLKDYARDLGGDRAETLALQAWALAHGLAMLILDGRLPADPALADRVIDPHRTFAFQPGNSSEASP